MSVPTGRYYKTHIKSATIQYNALMGKIGEMCQIDHNTPKVLICSYFPYKYMLYVDIFLQKN